MQAVIGKRTPTMVGIDPRWASLPTSIKENRGSPLSADSVAEAYHQFGLAILDTTADLVPAVKFQSAFFEAVGPAGVQVLWSLARHASSLGLVVVMDAKRGDIGSTADAYAEAYLAPLPGETAPIADALTVNPFLGRETIEPFLKSARQHRTGVFVLVRTSNPGSADLQMEVQGGQTISSRIGSWVEDWSASSAGELGFGDVGAVVGATHRAELRTFRDAMPHTPILLPGYGAQGGSAADLRDAFDDRGLGAVVNNSRGIIFAYQSEKHSAESWKESVRDATQAMIADLARHTSAGNL
ncbi:orotidine-5'-phosphate decarboxylase [bacterium]|nr:orotidine-5'-phosphate decarboxylase [bacterium]